VFSVLASPQSFLWSRWLDRFASASDPAALRTHYLVERWALDEFPLPGALLADIVNGLYREDRFMKGTLAVGARTAAAANVSAPIFAVVDPHSDVVPVASVLPFISAAASRAKRVVEYEPDVGVGLRHLGALIGRSAHRSLWPQLLAWARGRGR
jgi:poly[(R)-3-hydroxyalkanoate] polymerase subunit PhaC